MKLSYLLSEKFNLWLSGTLVAGLFALYVISGLIAYNGSESEPIGFYHLEKAKDLIKGQRYLVQKPKLPTYVTNPKVQDAKFLLKTLEGMPGDSLYFDKSTRIFKLCIRDTISCKEFPPLVEKHPVTEQAIKGFEVTGEKYVLKENEYWFVASGHPNSVDSRYLGPFNKQTISYKANLVWKIS